MKPLISVALCTYNGEAYLAEQLDSVLAQDWPNLEIVVVDDGSSDRTPEILRRYEARDPRIQLHFNEANLGFLANFEKAFALTRGDFIAPCDQDDWWNPAKLTALYEVLGGRGLAFCDSLFMDRNGESLGTRVSDVVNMYAGDDPAAFVFGNCISGHAALVRRSVVARAMPFPRGHFHDWWLAFVAASTEGLVYLPEALVRYRQHPSAQTNLAERKPRARTARSRLAAIRARQDWVDVLASFAGHHQPYFAQLSQAHGAWQSSWVCPRLAALLLQRRRSLFFINHTAAVTRWWCGFRFVVGLRAKQRLFPSHYGESKSEPGFVR